MLRRVVASLAALVLAAGGTLTSASAAGTRASSVSSWKTVSYRGVTARVPAPWPVFDLERDPSRCARTDVEAVYLGHQGQAALCPSVIVGAAEAIQLEPWDTTTEPMLRRAGRGSVDGAPARIDDSSRASGRLVRAFERERVVVRVLFGDDAELADEVVGGLRVEEAQPAVGPEAAATGTADAPPPQSPPISAAAVAAAASQPAPLAKGIYQGDGFDTCANPDLTKMTAWLASPYRAIGIYVGGINHGCKAQTLSADWVADAARMGWAFWPLYVGRQAPCYPGSTTAKIDPAQAAVQGTAAADDAIAQSDKYGLPTGSPLYFDMEAYSGNATCVNAVHTFLQAWTTRLHQRGYVSGVYSSEASGVANLADKYGTPGYVSPDVIWTAHWGESKRIFGHNPEWLPDGIWKNHQRIHQYQGGHTESWGGQSINIDNDYADAPAVRFTAKPRWLAGQIDGTGGTDLVHLCCGDYANTWLSNGDGTFSVMSFRPWSRYDLQLGSWMTLDLNGDGKSDLIHKCCADYVHTWISNGDGTYVVGTFRPWVGYNMSLGSFLPADVNGDGKPDLVHLCCKDYAHLWLSNGDGTFTVTFFKPWTGYGLQLGKWLAVDLDVDGATDLVHLCCADYVHVWMSDGDGTFTITAFKPWKGYGLQQGRWAISDANGDGKQDLVHLCCADSVRLWSSDGDGTFTVSGFRPWTGYGLQQGQWFASDFDGDAKGDLVHLCCADSARLWRSNGDGSYTVSSFQPWPGYQLQSGSWTAGDLEADGDGDLYHFCCVSRILIWISQANGTYQVVGSPI